MKDKEKEYEKLANESWFSEDNDYRIVTNEDIYIYAFKKGLKASGIQWHKVADGDLPDHTRNVWTNVGPSYYDIEDHCWRDDFGRTYGVVAWCEPKFEE